MAQKIITQPLTKINFQDFGEVIDTGGDPDMLINQGLCERYHDRAKIDAVSYTHLTLPTTVFV